MTNGPKADPRHSPSSDAWICAVSLIEIRAPGLSQSIEIDQREDKKFRQGFTGAPAAAVGSKNRNRLPCLLPVEGGSELVPYVA